MARDEYLQKLASVPLFSKCTNRQLQEIVDVATELTFPAGEALVRQGEVGFDMFIILDGTVSVTRDGERVATLTAGDAVGELAVLSGHPRSATVEAETELRILDLTHPDFDRLLDDIPGLAKHLLYEVSSRLVAGTPKGAP